MKNLPINEVIPEIKSKLYKHTKLILQAPPRAGKSTIVPISLLDKPWLKDKIIITWKMCKKMMHLNQSPLPN